MAKTSTIQPVLQSPLNKTRIDKWILIFNLPMAMRKRDGEITGKGRTNMKSVQFSLKSVSVPKINVKGISQRYGSGNLYISSHSKEPFDLLQIKFDIDNHFNNYISIFEWLNFLHDEKEAIPDPNNLLSDQIGVNTYWTNLGLVGLDEYNNPQIMFTFTQAFPTELSGWDFNYTDDRQIEATASFAFSQLHSSYPTDKL